MYEENEIDLRERFIVLYFNRRSEYIGYILLGVGGISGTVADVRIVMAVALKCLATGIILSHNHPSGQLKPSLADKTLTTDVKRVCDYHQVELLDHIIISSEGYFSFADEGLL